MVILFWAIPTYGLATIVSHDTCIQWGKLIVCMCNLLLAVIIRVGPFDNGFVLWKHLNEGEGISSQMVLKTGHKCTSCSFHIPTLFQLHAIFLLVNCNLQYMVRMWPPTFVLDKNNDSVSKDRSIRAGKSNEKCFVVFFREFVLGYWYVYTSAPVTINTENNGLMCGSVVCTSCWKRNKAINKNLNALFCLLLHLV